MEKKAGPPDGFVWCGEIYRVSSVEMEWHDYQRKGYMARNMRSTHAHTARRRGLWGVGNDHYRLRMTDGRVFNIYYDRVPENADRRKESWLLDREMVE